jgi:hypothetical protein
VRILWWIVFIPIAGYELWWLWSLYTGYLKFDYSGASSFWFARAITIVALILVYPQVRQYDEMGKF